MQAPNSALIVAEFLVGGSLLRGLLLQSGLLRLLLRLLLLALARTAAHRAHRGSDRRSFAGIACDRAERGSPGRTANSASGNLAVGRGGRRLGLLRLLSLLRLLLL